GAWRTEVREVRTATRALAERRGRGACAARVVRRALADSREPPLHDGWTPYYRGWVRVPGGSACDTAAEMQFARALACAAAGLPLPPVADDAAAERVFASWFVRVHMPVPPRTHGVAFVERSPGIPEQDPAGWIASATNDQRAAAFVAVEARVRRKTGGQGFAARVGGGR